MIWLMTVPVTARLPGSAVDVWDAAVAEVALGLETGSIGSVSADQFDKALRIALGLA